jgi:hypothetical protein
MAYNGLAVLRCFCAAKEHCVSNARRKNVSGVSAGMFGNKVAACFGRPSERKTKPLLRRSANSMFNAVCHAPPLPAFTLAVKLNIIFMAESFQYILSK